MAPLIKLNEVTKTFPGVKALSQVSLEIYSGEILALVGENGAGKSTLMKVLSGTYPAGSFTGQILVDGQTQLFKSPLDAENAGVAIIHQELSSFLHLTVAENLFVGHWPKSFGGLIDLKRLSQQAEHWIKMVGASCKPSDRMGDLSVGQQQLIEIAKALSRESRVLILDEPTSALTPREVDKLFELLRQLRDHGKGLVYISHKMDEIYALADRITVLRDGQTVHTAQTAQLPEDKLIQHMVGRSLDRLFPDPPTRTAAGAVVLKLENFSGFALNGRPLFGPISLELRGGEILGFSGLLGAGRSELLQGIFGDRCIKTTGRMWLHGKLIQHQSTREALRNRVSFVGEDRKRDSILPTRSLDENVSLARLASGSLSRIIDPAIEWEHSRASLRQLNTKATGPEMLISQLSGGNQQKVIIGRALQVAPDVILMDEPTRGVDVGAKYEIYELVFRLAKEGKALLVVSSDLPELMALSDHIMVLSEGHQTGLLQRSQFSQEAIMKCAIAGGSHPPATLASIDKNRN